MIDQLLNKLTEDEQRTFLTHQLKDGEPTDAKQDSDNESFHSAASCENVMKCDATPFILPSSSVANYQPESVTEVNHQTQTDSVLHDKLNKQVVVMKAQHQFIQNL